MDDVKYSGSLEHFFDAVHSHSQPFEKVKAILGMTLKSDDYAQFDSVYLLAKEANPKLVYVDESLFLKDHELSEKLRSEGNKLFAQKKHREALERYTKALRYAPWLGVDECVARRVPVAIVDNSQRARCHANRAAVMLEFGKYQLCCDEVDRALANDYPNERAWYLLDRKARASFEMGYHRGTARCIQTMEHLLKNMDRQCKSFKIHAYLNLPDEAEKAAKAIDALKERMEKAGAELTPRDYVFPTDYEDDAQREKLKAEQEASSETLAEEKEEATNAEEQKSAGGDTEVAVVDEEALKKFPNAANIIVEVQKEGKGFGFETKKAILPGTAVIRERCLVRFLDADCWLTHCFNCFMRCNECPLPCKFTPAIVFCSERCADTQSSLGFAKICGFLPFVSGCDGAGTRLVRLAYALFARHRWVDLEELFYGPGSVYLHDSQDNYEPKVCKSDISALLWMSRSPKSENDTEWVWQHTVQAMFVTKLLCPQMYCGKKDDQTICRLGALVLRAIKVLDANGFCAHENVAGRAGSPHLYMNDIGIFVATTVARLNHSCVPNVAAHFGRGTVTVRTLVPVKAGEELCLSYGPDAFCTEDRAERQTKLKSGWGFECVCDPCGRNLPSIVDLANLILICENCGTPFPEAIMVNGCRKCGKSGENLSKFVRAKLNEIGDLEREMLSGLGRGENTEKLAKCMVELREKLMPRLCAVFVELSQGMHPDCAMYMETVGMIKNFLDFTNNPHVHRSNAM